QCCRNCAAVRTTSRLRRFRGAARARATSRRDSAAGGKAAPHDVVVVPALAPRRGSSCSNRCFAEPRRQTVRPSRNLGYTTPLSHPVLPRRQRPPGGTPMHRTILAAAVLCAATATTALAQQTEIDAELQALEASFHYQQGVITLAGGLATLNVPESFRFLGPEDASRLLVEGWG